MIAGSQIASFVAVATCLFSARAAELQDPKKYDADVKKYRSEVVSKLEAKDFAWLDQEAGELQKTRAHSQVGGWRLWQFSSALTSPRDAEEIGHWDTRIGLLHAWNENSKTAFSTEMDGVGHLTAAWLSRGNDFASKVPKKGWDGFEKELDKAEPLLEESFKKDPKNPDICQQLLHVGISRGWTKEKMMETLKQGIAAAPDYLDNYEMMAYWELPRWFGQPGDWQRFINSILELVPGDDGYAMYANTVAMTWSYIPQQEIMGEDRDDRVSWKKVKHGFDVLKTRYPESAGLVNREAFMGSIAQDVEVVKKDVKILEEKDMFIPAEWASQENLDAVRKVVKQMEAQEEGHK
jgi:hypothetical protein